MVEFVSVFFSVPCDKKKRGSNLVTQVSWKGEKRKNRKKKVGSALIPVPVDNSI